MTAASAADARLLARALPSGSVWAADLSRASRPPSADDVALLRDAGCGGMALPALAGDSPGALSDGAVLGCAQAAQ